MFRVGHFEGGSVSDPPRKTSRKKIYWRRGLCLLKGMLIECARKVEDY
jgi:hypothetical protein